MSDIAIKAENISKLYRLGNVNAASMRDDMLSMWARMRGKEDPVLSLAQANDRTQKGTSEYVWSLKDINFEVKKGDILGIVGRNGAGKSTLLKILSKVTAPTTGQIKVNGRIASLLEVGTGFHPELTGRENIYLNGHILGMRKKEIDRKFDEIVDFSGVERYIDTPVKRYSSGMYVRLAFGVAAHLESDILIIDEVLAVGDAEFQKKCLGKMQDVSKGEGRTVLFVSHNMAAVKELCNNAIMLKNGHLVKQDATKEIIKLYLENPLLIKSNKDLISDMLSRRGNGEVRFTSISINNDELYLDPQKDISIKMRLIVIKSVSEINLSLMVKGSESNEAIANTGIIEIMKEQMSADSEIELTASIAANTFRTGLFPIYFWLGKKGRFADDNYPYDVIDSVYYLNLHSDKTRDELGYSSTNPGGYFNFNPKITNSLKTH